MHSSRRRFALCSVALVIVGLVACSEVADPPSPAPSPPPSSARPLAPADGPDRARELLAEVTVVERRPDVPGYDRSCSPGDGCVFGTEWSDATDAPLSRNGCDTRNDVLARDLTDVRFSRRSPDCDVTGGTLADPYTGREMDYATEGSQIHVDHLFPLAAAWDLGAAGWTPERRERFANDVDLELLAVEGSANLSKGDSTPASWLPPRKAFRCTYVTAYLEVAHAYDLAITEADVRVIEPVLTKSC
ncbi:HNH endonuclease family protein [Nocardioides sp. C4-1]|uniref:HNH endonuclease family protein n=1 Tax=Nocardioides sp. C4-1 TaxID=3151851 RepID=UPI00326615AF